jgi:hypothetical protein
MGATAQDIIGRKVDALFDALKLRYLGPGAFPRGDKSLVLAWHAPELSLPGVLRSASALEGVRPDPGTEDTLVRLASGFLDATRERTKAQVLRAVTSFLTQAQTSGVKTNLETVLGGELAKVFADTRKQVFTVLDAETATAKNVGLMDGLTRVNAHLGIADPTVYFVVVHDAELCQECRAIHLLEDGLTPRLWLLSEVVQGYHKRGVDRPSIGGLHPHCRCTLCSLMPGYGFTAGGMVEYKSPDWNEFERQRGLGKSELGVVDLVKGVATLARTEKVE